MNGFSIQRELPIHRQIADHLERRIRSGELRDGEFLPTTLQAAEIYNVSQVTAQKSLKRLVKLDLIERIPGRGTIVKSAHTANTIAVVFGHDPFQARSMYYLRLLRLFRDEAMKKQLNLKIYLDLHEAKISRALFDLRQDVVAGKVKSIVAIDGTPELVNWLKEQKYVPWIVPPYTDLYSAVKAGTSYLLNIGFSRIIVVSMSSRDMTYSEGNDLFRAEKAGCRQALRGHKAEATVVRWGDTDIDGYRETRSLFSRRGKLPDAIFVNHDVVCRGVLLALMELGIKIPNDVGILTHANAGCEFASPTVLTRILVDPSNVVTHCLNCLQSTSNTTSSKLEQTAPFIQAKIVPGKSCGE